MSTMLDRGTAIAAAVEVEKYSKQGTELLQAGHLTSAVKAFKYAYKYAGDMDDEYMERACAFNLGAAYIAMGQGEKGLNILQKAVPSEERRDGRSNGDLYFNFGLGYEVTKNVHEAVRYFNKALDEYRLERDNLTMEIETLSKLSVLCVATNNHNLMNIYHQLAEAYAMQENTDKQMWALCEKANSYYSYGDPEKAESAADDCLKLSDKCHSTIEAGNYNVNTVMSI
jgi:tetratricopeptide (TPR) repeat protein